MKIIVDTNIVFSAILNTDGKIADILIDTGEYFQFYTSDYLRYELIKHHEKLKKFSGLTDNEIEDSTYRVSKYINFLNIEIIPNQIWKKAEAIVSDIDINDIDFVALTLFLRGTLWTGDKRLFNGLKSKYFKNVVNSSELWEERERLLKI
jgi:predicted nucleic acid-binding protein